MGRGADTKGIRGEEFCTFVKKNHKSRKFRGELPPPALATRQERPSFQAWSTQLQALRITNASVLLPVGQ